jgi:hypothetical protein
MPEALQEKLSRYCASSVDCLPVIPFTDRDHQKISRADPENGWRKAHHSTRPWFTA